MPKGRKGTNKTFNCLHCGKENAWGWSKVNKFCDNQCQGDWKWINETIPRIEAGQCTHNSHAALKRYLIEKHGHVCSVCGQLPEWNNMPLSLQLDHIDGNSDNNWPDNIRLICPNCHTQTDTFGSKGLGSRYKKVTKRNEYIREYRGSIE